MPMALRALASPTSIESRKGAQALAEGLRPGFGSEAEGAAAANSAPKSVITSLAGFAQTGSSSPAGNGFAPAESVITSIAGFESAGSMITSMAGFAGEARPHPPGGRRAIPAKPANG